MSYQVWGNTIWFLFHGLSHKLKPEHENISIYLRDMYYNICNNLPCSICSTHAMNTIKQYQMSRIKTKNDLQDFCWHLHNEVNKKLNKPIFSKKERDTLYEKINTKQIIQNFIYIMNYNYRTEKGMMGSMYRKLLLDKYKKFLVENLDKFNE